MPNLLSQQRTAVIYLILLVLLGGTWWVWQARPARPVTPVIIYLVDTLRADRLSIYGYPVNTSPNLEAIAAESVIFERAYAPAPWTLPSVASLITSTFVCEHGLVTERKKLNSSIKTLAQHLNDIGYFTGGFYNNLYVGPLSGLDRGYEYFETRTNERAEDVRDFLNRAADRPFLFYLHSVEPHDPDRVPYAFIQKFGSVDLETRQAYHEALQHYNRLRTVDWVARQPPGTTDNSNEQAEAFGDIAAFREPVQILYNAAVLYADDNLGDVVDILKQTGVWNKAVFIFLSDHGDEFAERGGWGHDQSVYDELMRVPLIVHFPNHEFAGQRVSEAVSLVDVMPTIFDYLRVPELCEHCRGDSLLPLLRQPTGREDSAPRVFAQRINEKRYNRESTQRHGDVNVVIQKDHWKAIWNDEVPSLELYDLRSDPSEQFDLSSAHPAVALSLEQHAAAWLRECETQRRNPQEIYGPDQETIKQLRALGYFN